MKLMLLYCFFYLLNLEVTQLQFGESFSKILTPFESIYLNISVEEDLLIQLDLIVNSGQAALYVSNLVIPSEAVHCGTIETNTSGQIHINTSEMSSYGSNQLLLITIMAMEEVTTLTFQSTQLHLKGNHIKVMSKPHPVEVINS